MSAHHIRAQFDANTITVYQAYNAAIADAALAAQKFVAPFSFTRMTWVKPSFLWMMERCGWATKPNQERVLAVALRRESFEHALSMSVLTHAADGDVESWRRQLEVAPVRVQWDPERNARGTKLNERSLQVGLGRAVVPAYATEWIHAIHDVTPLVHKLANAKREGRIDVVERHLPRERVYPLTPALAARIGAD